MLKKLLFSVTFALVGLFTLGIASFAATKSFTYTNAYSDYYFLSSDTVLFNQDASVYVLTIPDNPYTVYELGGVRSYIIFYSGLNGTGTTEFVYLDDLDDTLSINKTYIVQVSDLSITPLSVKIILMTNLRDSSAPSGYVAFMSAETEYGFTTPNTVVYYDAFAVWETYYYINTVPTAATPTREGFTFDVWRDINGDPYEYQLPPRADQLNAEGQFLLYSSFYETIEVDLDSFDFFPDFGAPTTPIGIILLNTGFYNYEGMTFLFVLLIIAANIALWYFKAPMFTNLIASAVIIALFMFGGYLPLYVPIIMIALIVTIFFSMKGGILNE